MAQRFVRAAQERDLLELAFDLKVSEKRLLGWEPTEWHEYEYDEQGRVARVTVTREPEWDDQQRRRMQALMLYRDGICSECGVHHSQAEDPDFYWTWETRKCSVCASTAAFLRGLADRDEEDLAKLGENPAAPVERPDDGRRVILRELSPFEAAAEKRR